MISREKMDKLVPIVQGAIVALYLVFYIAGDVLHVKRTIQKSKKKIKQ